MSSDVKSIRYLAQSEMLAENGIFRRIPAILKERNYKQPTFIVDEGFASSTLWCEVKNSVDKAFGYQVNYHILSCNAEPTYASLSETVERIREIDQDVFIGVGGGSCMDTTKAVAALIMNPGDPILYRGFDQLKVPGIPTILVPTTAGTGSEAAYNASFVDEESKRKMGINGRYMFAALAVLDGETTLTCPYKASLSAGIDALVHTLEGFVCRQRNVMTDMIVKKAFPLLVNALPSLKADPTNIDQRLNLLLGAYLGGMIQMNSGSGIAAAISYPLSVYYKVPHGIGGGMFCLDVMRFNIEAGFYLYSELAPLIGIGNTGSSEQENAWAVLHHLEELWALLGVPRHLTAFGVEPHSFDAVMKTMQTQQPGFDENPATFTVQEHLPKLLEPFFAEVV